MFERDEHECPTCDGWGVIGKDVDPAIPDSGTCSACKGAGWRLLTDEEENDRAESAYSDMCEREPPLSARERDEMQAKRDAQWGVK